MSSTERHVCTCEYILCIVMPVCIQYWPLPKYYHLTKDVKVVQ